jgi:hypothetical protein
MFLFLHALDGFLEALKFVGRGDLAAYSSNWYRRIQTHIHL